MGVFVITQTHLVHYSDYEKGRGDVNAMRLADEIQFKITQVQMNILDVLDQNLFYFSK